MKNIRVLGKIELILDADIPVDFGYHKRRDLVRLAYEICLRDDIVPDELLPGKIAGHLEKSGKSHLFDRLKRDLLRIRYPGMPEGSDPRMLPLVLDDAFGKLGSWGSILDPKNIFIEKGVTDNKWLESFLSFFSSAKITRIKSRKDLSGILQGNHQPEDYGRRRKNIIIEENKSAFIKVCPCTKEARRCGYWVLNIGFGCPIDCSYCFLQAYSNVPGLVLPANIGDYFEYIADFDKRASGRTRIGTGEFTDSLALDKYTGYSDVLIPVFGSMKHLVLELKTKVADIDHLFNSEPNDNVVISWSLNTPELAERYENGGALIEDRINAAERAAERGYRIGFHFDPIIQYPGWENAYKELVDNIFSRELIRMKTEWISLGTLRYVPGLKQIAEQRFEDCLLYYWGDFFQGMDGKMRYTDSVRKMIYAKMTGWIKKYPMKAWVYLCMEPGEMWKDLHMEKNRYC